MKALFEYDDVLNRPVEAFCFDTTKHHLPVETHLHYFIEVLYMYEGSIEVWCNDKRYVLNVGDMIFMPPLAMHSIYRLSKEECRYAVIKFSADRIRLHGDYLPKIGTIFQNPALSKDLPIYFAKGQIPNYDLERFSLKCIAEIQNKCYGYDSVLYSEISEFLVNLLRYWHNEGYDESLKAFDNTKEYSIHNIILYIGEQLSRMSHEPESGTGLFSAEIIKIIIEAHVA